MKFAIISLLIVLCLIDSIVGPPVKKTKEEEEAEEEAKKKAEEELTENDISQLEYQKYLKEVVSALEEDEAFRRKLEQSNASDIKSGDIAKHLEFVSHNVRTKLDELKRQEIERIRQLVRIQQRQKKGTPGIKPSSFDVQQLTGHIDHKNMETFEIDDLSKLIKQATRDLEDLDKKRRSEFKAYEMEKELQKREKLQEISDEQIRAEEKKKFEQAEQKHKDHPKLHHPGSRDQLEDVWEETDGLNKDDFDPTTFFHLHDINGDGYLDEDELEALFRKELDKAYDPNAPEDDMMERFEEMNRMREHVMKEVDRDGDKMVSMREFIESTKTKEFQKDEGWDTIEDNDQFSEDELEQYQKEIDEARRQKFAGHIQPGEINIPPQHQPLHEQQASIQHMQQQQQGQQQHHEAAQGDQALHFQGQAQQQHVPPVNQAQQQHVPPVNQAQQQHVPPVNQGGQQQQQFVPPPNQGQQAQFVPPVVQGQGQQQFVPPAVNQVRQQPQVVQSPHHQDQQQPPHFQQQAQGHQP